MGHWYHRESSGNLLNVSLHSCGVIRWDDYYIYQEQLQHPIYTKHIFIDFGVEFLFSLKKIEVILVLHVYQWCRMCDGRASSHKLLTL